MFVDCISYTGHTNNHYKIDRKNSTNSNRTFPLYNCKNNHSNRIAVDNVYRRSYCATPKIVTSCCRLFVYNQSTSFVWLNEINEIEISAKKERKEISKTDNPTNVEKTREKQKKLRNVVRSLLFFVNHFR